MCVACFFVLCDVFCFACLCEWFVLLVFYLCVFACVVVFVCFCLCWVWLICFELCCDDYYAVMCCSCFVSERFVCLVVFFLLC